MEIFIPVLALGSLGLLFGIGLGLAARKFYVHVDPRIKKVFAYLPGSNCGACGQAGCMRFAESLIKGDIDVDSCVVSEDEDKTKIAGILGIETGKKVKKVAVLHCQGGNKVRSRFEYKGIKDCVCANLVFGGPKACVYGCLGFGDCVQACPFDAIVMTDEGLPKVIEEKCRACGKCVQACPKGLFSLVDVNKKFYVACSSPEMGKNVMSVCRVGCIGCRKCEKVCPVGAIKVTDNLAKFDYQKCENIGKCVQVCPTKVIVKRSN